MVALPQVNAERFFMVLCQTLNVWAVNLCSGHCPRLVFAFNGTLELKCSSHFQE